MQQWVTNMASGSLMTSPFATSELHHYHNGVEKSNVPFTMGIINSLKEETKLTTMHLDELFLHVLM